MKQTEFEERVKKLFQKGRMVWILTNEEEFPVTGYSIIGNRVFFKFGNERIKNSNLEEIIKVSSNRMIYRYKGE